LPRTSDSASKVGETLEPIFTAQVSHSKMKDHLLHILHNLPTFYSNKLFRKLAGSAGQCDLLHSWGPARLNGFSSLKMLLQAKFAILFILQNIMSHISKITLNLK